MSRLGSFLSSPKYSQVALNDQEYQQDLLAKQTSYRSVDSGHNQLPRKGGRLAKKTRENHIFFLIFYYYWSKEFEILFIITVSQICPNKNERSSDSYLVLYFMMLVVLIC